MVASTDIKFYVHTNTGAPQLQNAFGCMIDVLDACLVNGFGSQTVSTLTASGTTATATFGSAHNFMQYQVINIAGATQTEYNGEFRILTVPNANSITFQLAAVPSVTTATGTISCSLPSLGWLKPFSGTGKAAYRSANTLLASRPYLRVVDALDAAYTSTYAKYAKVGIVEDMTDIDTLLGVQAPYDSANPDKNWVGTGSGTSAYNGWAKWYYAHGAAHTSLTGDTTTPANGNRNWLLVGTTDYFYIFPAAIPNNTFTLAYGFGSFKTLLNLDNSNVFLSATYNYNTAAGSYFKGESTGLLGSIANQKLLLQRGYSQTANYVEAGTVSLGVGVGSVRTGYSNYIGAYSLASVSPFAPVFINETVLRGEVPNLNWLFQQKPYNNYQFIEKDNTAYMAVDCAPTSGQGQIIIKLGDL